MESQRFHSQAVREAVGLTWERLGLSADPQPDHRAYLCLFFSLHALQQQQLRQEQQKGTCSSMALALPSYEELSRAAQALRSSPEKGLLSLLELQELAEWAICTAEWRQRSRLIIFAAAMVLATMLASSGLLLLLPWSTPGIALLPTLVLGPLAGLLLVIGMDSGAQPVIRRPRPRTSSKSKRSRSSGASHSPRPHHPSHPPPGVGRAASPARPTETPAPAPAPDPFARVMQAAEPVLAAGLHHLLTKAARVQEHVSQLLLGKSSTISNHTQASMSTSVAALQHDQEPDAAALGRARMISHALDMPPGPDAERFVSELLGVLTGEELDAAQQDEQAASKECERPEVQVELVPDSTRLSKLLRSGTPGASTTNNAVAAPPLHVVIHDSLRRMDTEGTTCMSGASHLVVLEPGTPSSHTQRKICVPKTLGGSSTNGRKSHSSDTGTTASRPSVHRPLCSATEYAGGAHAGEAVGSKLYLDHQEQQQRLDHPIHPEPPGTAAAPAGCKGDDSVSGKDEVVALLSTPNPQPSKPEGKPHKEVAPNSHKLSRSAIKAVARARKAAAQEAMQAGLRPPAPGAAAQPPTPSATGGGHGLAGALRKLAIRGEAQGGDNIQPQHPASGPAVERPTIQDVQNRMGDPVLVYAGNPKCRIGLEEEDQEGDQQQQQQQQQQMQRPAVVTVAKQQGATAAQASKPSTGTSGVDSTTKHGALSKMQHKISSKLRKLLR